MYMCENHICVCVCACRGVNVQVSNALHNWNIIRNVLQRVKLQCISYALYDVWRHVCVDWIYIYIYIYIHIYTYICIHVYVYLCLTWICVGVHRCCRRFQQQQVFDLQPRSITLQVREYICVIYPYILAHLYIYIRVYIFIHRLATHTHLYRYISVHIYVCICISTLNQGRWRCRLLCTYVYYILYKHTPTEMYIHVHIGWCVLGSTYSNIYTFRASICIDTVTWTYMSGIALFPHESLVCAFS